MNSLTRTCICNMHLSVTISIIYASWHKASLSRLCGIALKSSWTCKSYFWLRISGDSDWLWIHQKFMKKGPQKMKARPFFYIKNGLCWDTLLFTGCSGFKETLSADQFSIKKKTNLSLVPVGLTLQETKAGIVSVLITGSWGTTHNFLVGRDGFHNRLIYLTVIGWNI